MSARSQLPSDAIPQPSSTQNGAEEEAKRAQEEQMRRDLMATVLDSAARERLSRISMVSPERSRQIEGVLLQMAQTKQLKGQVNEAQLINLLEQLDEVSTQKSAKKSTIVYQRRRDFDDDDDF